VEWLWPRKSVRIAALQDGMIAAQPSSLALVGSNSQIGSMAKTGEHVWVGWVDRQYWVRRRLYNAGRHHLRCYL
jgi:hypothetical protein